MTKMVSLQDLHNLAGHRAMGDLEHLERLRLLIIAIELPVCSPGFCLLGCRQQEQR
jgi:hypothetical protein